MYGCHIVVVHLATYNLDKVLVRLELHVLDRHLVHFLDDAGIMRSQHLSAVAPVSLISVVFLRVVRSSNVHASLSAELTNGERNFRGRAKTFEKICLDAVG